MCSWLYHQLSLTGCIRRIFVPRIFLSPILEEKGQIRAFAGAGPGSFGVCEQILAVIAAPSSDKAGLWPARGGVVHSGKPQAGPLTFTRRNILGRSGCGCFPGKRGVGPGPRRGGARDGGSAAHFVRARSSKKQEWEEDPTVGRIAARWSAFGRHALTMLLFSGP